MNNNIIKLITYKKPNAIVVGSQVDDDVKFKNDTDIFETVVFHTDEKEFIKEVYEMIITIINHIKSNTNIYFMEFKAGIYEPLYISDNDILNKTKRTAFYKKCLKQELIDKDIFDTINELDNQSLLYFCSNLYKVRWAISDLNKKSVVLFNGHLYQFSDIFNNKSTIKIDILYYDGNIFLPFSNMFKIINNNKSITEESADVKTCFEDEIKVLLKDNNYYKAIKRLYLLSKINDDETLKEKLLLIINSSAGELYLLKGYIENCEELLYKYRDKETSNKVLHSLEYINENKILSKRVNNLITKTLGKKTVKTIIKSLIKIKDIMNIEVVKQTKKLISKYKIEF